MYHPTTRVLAVLELLQSRPGISGAAIAARLEVDRRTVRRYNAMGPEALREHRGGALSSVLNAAGREALKEALVGQTPPGGGLWTGQKVADWIEARTGIQVSDQTGLNYLHALGFSPQRPRPRHPQADPEAQEAFKKGGSLPRSKR